MVYGNWIKDNYLFLNENSDISDSLEEDIVYMSNDDVSLFTETLDFILNENMTCSTIFESFGSRLIDQIKRFSPNKLLSTIIDKFIEILKTIWNHFEALCIGILSKAGAVKRFKGSIMKLSEPVLYSAPHYTYTNIREDSSRTNFDLEVNDIYNNFLDTMECIKSTASYGDVQNRLEEIESKFRETGSYFETLRGNIIGKEICSKENFANELYAYFRNGTKEPIEDEYVSPYRIKDMLSNLELTKNTKAIKKTKEDIEKQANRMKAKYRATKLEDYIGKNESNNNIAQLYTKCIQTSISKTQELCNIYLQYYAAKLDAAKEEYSTDLKILFAAAQEAVRKGL